MCYYFIHVMKLVLEEMQLLSVPLHFLNNRDKPVLKWYMLASMEKNGYVD